MTITKNLIRLFLHISVRRRWQLGGLLALMLVGALAEMATLGAVVPFLALLADPSIVHKYPLFQQSFMWGETPPNNVALSAALLFGIVAIGAGFVRMLLMWVSLRISFGLGADIGSEVYRRTLYQPYSWHVSRNSSEILSGIDKVNNVIGGIITPLLQGAVAVVLSLGILAMLITVDPETAFTAGLGFCLLYGVTTYVLRRKLVRNSKIISANITHRVRAVQEGLGGIRDVLLDGTQPIYLRRFAAVDYTMRRCQAANNLIGASPRFIIEAVGMVLIASLAYWLTERQGGLSKALPVLGALAVGAQKLLPQMQLVYQSWSSISGNHNQLEDVLDLLERPIPNEWIPPDCPISTRLTLSQNVKTRIPLSPLDRKKGGGNVRDLPQQVRDGGMIDKVKPLIALRDVSFRYKPDAPVVLRSINLEIPRGSTVGFIGKTGSGKSTLIDLVMGFLEPTTGVIEIDGNPLREEHRRSWQLRLAHVPQSIFLSDATIAENIAFGVPVGDIDMPRVRSAAAKAELAHFIETLPQQYQTAVGERGVRLSGGQRQRIGLARALYKQADVLVLDEATSALDDATEESVMAAIKALGNELTVLMIAHRVSTLRDCDQIIELADGTVLRRGDYAALIG